MFPDVARESFSGSLPLFVGCVRFGLTLSADGFFDFLFQVGKKALALCAAWALSLIHFGLVWRVQRARHKRGNFLGS